MKKLEGFGYFGDEDLLTCNPKLRKLLFRKRKKNAIILIREKIRMMKNAMRLELSNLYAKVIVKDGSL